MSTDTNTPAEAPTQAAENPASTQATENATQTAENAKTLTLTEEALEALIKERLTPIKGKLDSAFSERDAALAKAEALEKKERDAEIARLTEEGKHKEAYEMQIAERDARMAALEKRNTELSRDNELATVLGSYTFRSDTAATMAKDTVLKQLVQKDDGSWVHKSGVSIRDFLKTFSENEENAFLFKPKASSGTGAQPPASNNGASSKKSVFDMTQDEVLQLIQEGKPLPRRK